MHMAMQKKLFIVIRDAWIICDGRTDHRFEWRDLRTHETCLCEVNSRCGWPTSEPTSPCASSQIPWSSPSETTPQRNSLTVYDEVSEFLSSLRECEGGFSTVSHDERFPLMSYSHCQLYKLIQGRRVMPGTSDNQIVLNILRPMCLPPLPQFWAANTDQVPKITPGLVYFSCIP